MTDHLEQLPRRLSDSDAFAIYASMQADRARANFERAVVSTAERDEADEAAAWEQAFPVSADIEVRYQTRTGDSVPGAGPAAPSHQVFEAPTS